MKSSLQQNPKSKIIEHGYINIYSRLNDEEKRQIHFKRLYKKKSPEWDETMVFLANEFKKYINKHKNMDLKVLDAGCGNGNYIIDENRRNISWAVGVDVDKNFTGKNICLDEIKIFKLENLPFDNQTFDTVVSLWVLEHLENPQQVFDEIYRVLKPNGVFIFATPNKNFLPLAALRIFKSKAFNHILNKILFGRKSQDIFDTFYRANTIKDIRGLVSKNFALKTLRLNYDPAYTSFEKATFFIGNIVHKILSKIGLSVTFPHIIGVLAKQ